MPNTIVKLVYKRDYFDVGEMKSGAKQTITITCDGAITQKEYAPGSRKAYATKKAKCIPAAFLALCTQLTDCIAYADRLNGYCDDTSEELTIYHKYGRVQKMDRGYGNEHTNIGSIMHLFLSCYLN